jgi:NADH:ubiquinone oxidoreductase subunit E
VHEHLVHAARRILATFEKALGVQKGGSTADFTLVEEECIAACANAPAVLCGTRYFLDVTTDQVTDIVGYLRKNPHPEGEVV